MLHLSFGADFCVIFKKKLTSRSGVITMRAVFFHYTGLVDPTCTRCPFSPIGFSYSGSVDNSALFWAPFGSRTSGNAWRHRLAVKYRQGIDSPLYIVIFHTRSVLNLYLSFRLTLLFNSLG